jgi:hypothetical protein
MMRLFRSPWRPLRFLTGALLAALLAASCTTLQLVESYDPQIEKTLNEYHTDFITFVALMERSANTPEGAYSSDIAQKFYAKAAGLLANLVVRAEANNPGATCLPSSVVASGLGSLLSRTVEAIPETNSGIAEIDALGAEIKEAAQEFSQGTSELSIGSCTVVVLKALQLNNAIFESIHKDERFLQPPVSTIGADIISDGVRLGIIVEQSKKP